MANTILTQEDKDQLLKPIDEYVGKIQDEIDQLRADGATLVRQLENHMILLKDDKSLNKEERANRIAEDKEALTKAKEVEAKNRAEVDALVKKAETYINAHFDKDYLEPVKASCEAERQAIEKDYEQAIGKLKNEHEAELSKTSDKAEIKDENYVYKNRLYDQKMRRDLKLQAVKDEEHEAFVYRYHLIDKLRMSHFTFGQNMAQRRENYKYTFNAQQFLLQNGLYFVIIMVFVILGIVTPMVKGSPLFTYNNILNILQQASPRMFYALGVAGLILLTGTDLSVGRMVGMGMVASTIIMHQGPNTGTVFGKVFDLTKMSLAGRAILALLVCIVLCTIFTSIAGFFTAKFKMHPFISTMSNMLIIFGMVTYATKGVSFGSIDQKIPAMVIPKINGRFPTIIIWAVAAIAIVWFIWNKTTFGKNLYAVGGNPEAASASGISVFRVTLGAFILAGILYGFGDWLECNRMVGSGSAAYGQGWDMDAIAACVVGGVSFTGGIGKISGVVVGVLIFTALTYSLTILGVDTNLQFVFEGIIILAAVTLDCLKYIRKK